MSTIVKTQCVCSDQGFCLFHWVGMVIQGLWLGIVVAGYFLLALMAFDVI